MKSLMLLTLKNDLFGVNIEEDESFEDSYILTHKSHDYPFCTIYKDKSGYSVYEAINDEWRGIAIEDEKMIGCGLTINKAVYEVKKLQKSIYGNDDYPNVLEPWEGVLLKPKHTGFQVSGYDKKSDDYKTIIEE